MAPQPWIFTSPSSRGIGLQLTRRLLKATNLPVIATARTDILGTKERILDGLDVDKERLEVLTVDVTDESTVSAAAAHCKSRFPTSSNHLRLAFCLPGILRPEKSPSQVNYEHALQTFQINTLGPLLLLKHFSPFLPRRSTEISPIPNLPTSAVFALMSARVGSIADNRAGGWYSYRASKAGVNQLVKSLDIYLKNAAGEKAMSVALHPGTVKTGLSENFWATTPKEKLFSAESTAERLCKVVEKLGQEDRGKCWDWKGEEIPP